MDRTQNGSDGTRSAAPKNGKRALINAALCVVLSVGFLFASKLCLADAVVPDVLKPNVSSEAVEIEELRVGIAGVYKNGFKTPVVVSWKANARVDRIELETTDSDGVPFAVGRDLAEDEKNGGTWETRITLPRASAKLTARFIGEDVKFEKTFEPSNERAHDSKIVFSTPAVASKPIYLTIGSDNLGFAEAFAEMRWKEERRPSIVKIDSIEQLPSDFRGYDAVDKIFIAAAEGKAVLEGVDAASPKILAIERWVERGGDVTILANESAIPMLKSGAVLANLSPCENVADQAQEFRSVNALISELQNVKNLAMNGSKSKPFLRVPVLSGLKEGAKVEMQEVETPFLVVRPVGLGTTTYFAADPSVGPLDSWSGRGRLMLKLVGVDPDKSAAKSTSSNYVKRGYVDLSGQIRSALDVFDGVKTVSFSLVAGLIFAYLLCIAPLDWLVAKKLVKKPNVTWITFPILAIAFAVIGVAVVRSSTPDAPVMNQVDMIDVDMASGITRDSSWFGFYSPVGDRYEFKFAPKSLVGSDASYDVVSSSVEADLDPLTLAGAGIGGAEQKSYLTRVWSDAYFTQKDESCAKLTNTPLTTRSSKSFFGRWTGVLSDLPAVPELSDDGLTLRGAVINPFDVPIYSAYVVFQGGAYALGTLPPGETKIERGMTRLEPLRVLNEHQSSVPTAKLKNWDMTSYNNASTRLPYILRAASFYDLGGGEENFGIAKRLQRDVDLSDLIRSGRAVVFGTIVDAFADEYKATDELARKSADSIELERLNRKIAEQKGETFVNARENAIEKYGLTGSSDQFVPTEAGWRSNAEDEFKIADKRTVVVRLIVPLKSGTPHE